MFGRHRGSHRSDERKLVNAQPVEAEETTQRYSSSRRQMRGQIELMQGWW